ncbi:WD repeat-containing protein 76-like isoform X2 [Alosa sapidissima]|uniref:WD repeat-containing protein 76-like isoform X2 n=1 Tax=Alosa sapidissima TaxID=34773 RepID=UPI001C0A5C41|nr:WD repeat-containing protein 76-like isoform X2 [Alosa sapidissima]
MYITQVRPSHYSDRTQLNSQPNGTSETVGLRRSARNILTPKCLCHDHSVNPRRGRPTKRIVPTLSEYELKRLENIRQNKAFLSFLHLPQLTKALNPQLGKRKYRKRPEEGTLPVRKSLRLQKKKTESMVVVNSLKVPVPMCPVNLQEDSQLPESLLHLWTEEPIQYEWKKVDLQVYKEGLQNTHKHEKQVVKVVKKWIYSAAFHPCASSLLMAAGDKCGQVGLCNLGASWGDNGVLQFEPHTSSVTHMAFSMQRPSTLITTSYDGTARAGHMERAVFDEVYRSDKRLKGFDFLSHDCSTLLIGDVHGDIAIVDTRTPGTSHESIHTLGRGILYSAHIHPVQKQYFVVAVDSGVGIYDVRSLKESTQPVSVLDGHTRRVFSAYFSPDTGNRVLTTSIDKLRVFDASHLASTPLMTSIDVDYQRNMASRGPQRQALWDPKQEDCFMVSTTKQVNKIKVFHEGGHLVHVFDSPDYLTAVCSVMAFHPSRGALLQGDSQGWLHVLI